MRRSAAILFAIWAAAACAVVDGNATAPAAAPSAAVAATAEPLSAPPHDDHQPPVSFQQGPDAQNARVAQQAPVALGPDARRAVEILTPTVGVIPTAYAVEGLPTRPATAAELASLRAQLGGWVDSFLAMLERQRHPQAGVDPGAELRNTFSDTRLSSVVTRSLAAGDIYGQPTLTGAGWLLEGAVMRSWGSAAYADIAVNAIDHTPTDVPLQWRLRLETNGFWYRVIDLRDPANGAWVIGTAPRYSSLELETELRNAVAAYLNNESYSAFRPTSYAMSFADAPFFRARTEAINELNRAYASAQFKERYFESVRSSIERFEPAWFGGDGIVTVNVVGSVVETRSNGATVRTAFTQKLKFLRGHDMWIAIDAQNEDGTWASDGRLALAEVARPHG